MTSNNGYGLHTRDGRIELVSPDGEVEVIDGDKVGAKLIGELADDMDPALVMDGYEWMVGQTNDPTVMRLILDEPGPRRALLARVRVELTVEAEQPGLDPVLESRWKLPTDTSDMPDDYVLAVAANLLAAGVIVRNHWADALIVEQHAGQPDSEDLTLVGWGIDPGTVHILRAPEGDTGNCRVIATLAADRSSPADVACVAAAWLAGER